MALSKDPKALLLDLYHRKVALSQLPNGYSAYFQLGKVQWGYDLIDDTSGDELIEDIPSDMSQLETVFATHTASYTYVNGKIIIVATLPRDQILDGETHKWSCLGILDNDDELVGVVAVNSQTVTNKMDVSVTLEIDTTGEAAALSVI